MTIPLKNNFNDYFNSKNLKKILTDYFFEGIKKEKKKNIGVEIEHFILRKDTGTAVSYSEEKGILYILKQHILCYPAAKPIEEGHNLFGFKTNDFSVTLEPAGQYEVSIVQQEKIEDIYKIYQNFCNVLNPILDKLGYFLCRAGQQPISKTEDLELIPKNRYRFMSQYFKTSGTKGLDMMLSTASTQVSVDYFSQEDFKNKIQTSYLLTPVFQLISETVSDIDKNKNSYHLIREDIWRNTDNDRCGIVPNVFLKDYNFEMYAKYLCSVPLILKQKGNIAVSTQNATVEQVYLYEQTDRQDIEHIISMVFPTVRVKQYLEIRGADSMPEKQMFAYIAFVKGLIYSQKMLELCQKFIIKHNICEKDVADTQNSLMKYGYNGKIYGKSAVNVIKKLLSFAKDELDENEKKYIEPFFYLISKAYSVQKEYKLFINNNIERNRKSMAALKEKMEQSALYFNNRLTSKTLSIPKIYTKETVAKFNDIVKTMYGICVKVIKEYISNADYRKLFPFSKQLEELILVPNGYNGLLPVARFDIFFHEDTDEFYFCEINTDGTSGMNENKILEEMFIHNFAHKEITKKYNFTEFEMFDSWVKTFLSLYNTYKNKISNPNIAIVDFLDKATIKEFEEFVKHFQKFGLNCKICDIRDLKFENGKLFSKQGYKIDAIYRRAVTSDILDNITDIKPFIDAVKKQAVFLAGSFCTQIIHNKYFFNVLYNERTKAFLSEQENIFIQQHIPYTVLFSKEFINLETVFKNKNEYILKPIDSYASNGVFAGMELDDKTWQQKAKELYGKNYICQKYCPQYQTENIDFAFGDGSWHKYINMTGLFVYNGNLSGIYSRLAQGNGIIASYRNERTVPSFIVK